MLAYDLDVTVDARSMAFLRSYNDAASQLVGEGVHALAALDCYDWTDVCGQQNITSYPTVRVYSHGTYRPYTGMLDKQTVISTIKLYVSLTEGPYPANQILCNRHTSMYAHLVHA